MFEVIAAAFNNSILKMGIVCIVNCDDNQSGKFHGCEVHGFLLCPPGISSSNTPVFQRTDQASCHPQSKGSTAWLADKRLPEWQGSPLSVPAIIMPGPYLDFTSVCGNENRAHQVCQNVTTPALPHAPQPCLFLSSEAAGGTL